MTRYVLTCLYMPFQPFISRVGMLLARLLPSHSLLLALALSAGIRCATFVREAQDRRMYLRAFHSEQVASNLIEPGEDALLLNSGYFGDSFTEW